MINYLHISGDTSCNCGYIKIYFCLSYLLQKEYNIKNDIRVSTNEVAFCRRCKSAYTSVFDYNTSIDKNSEEREFVLFYEKNKQINNELSLERFAKHINVKVAVNYCFFLRVFEQLDYIDCMEKNNCPSSSYMFFKAK